MAPPTKAPNCAHHVFAGVSTHLEQKVTVEDLKAFETAQADARAASLASTSQKATACVDLRTRSSEAASKGNALSRCLIRLVAPLNRH